MTDVSIIVPVYNVEQFVGECLQSVMDQDATCSIECLIVDDKGSDESMTVVRDTLSGYIGKISFKIIEHAANKGLSAARNTGIRNAEGRYVYLLDSDDVITPDCIRLLYDRVVEHPGVQIVVGDFQTFPEKDVHLGLSVRGKSFPEYSDDVAWIRQIFLGKFPVIACNKLFLRSFIIDNSLFFKEGILHEDNHWHAAAYHTVSKIAFVDKITYLYRMRPGSITLSENTDIRRIQNLLIIYKEMFACPVAWDQPWARWVFDSIFWLKFTTGSKAVKKLAAEALSTCCSIIRSNSSCPRPLRMVYMYFTFPRILFSCRVLFAAFNKVISRLPKCS